MNYVNDEYLVAITRQRQYQRRPFADRDQPDCADQPGAQRAERHHDADVQGAAHVPGQLQPEFHQQLRHARPEPALALRAAVEPLHRARFQGLPAGCAVCGQPRDQAAARAGFQPDQYQRGRFPGGLPESPEQRLHRTGCDGGVRPGVQREPAWQPGANRLPHAAQRWKPDQRHQPHDHPAGRGGRPGVHVSIHQGERADQFLPESERGEPAHDDQLLQLHLQRAAGGRAHARAARVDAVRQLHLFEGAERRGERRGQQ